MKLTDEKVSLYEVLGFFLMWDSYAPSEMEVIDSVLEDSLKPFWEEGFWVPTGRS